ncbi:hypothetical protein DSM104299_00461 [Baekduia alba]|uniref:nuclear transport factor 2 family protein n=1 Tax=Baekduia alba TaxID=2997333 RepID=UPI00234151C6|nr:nuclear transport factor 2 family protein [Baekduia alba]WCB91784.1 hypothetical protein DSM104299_00461 [Baekduia alba]
MATLDSASAVPAALQALIEKEAIRELLARCFRGSDRELQALAESCHPPDGNINLGIYNGPVSGFFAGTAAFRAPMLAVHHHIGQSTIELDGDAAVGETYVLATYVLPGADGPQTTVLMTRYLDRFEKRGGEWKITDRRVAFDAQLDVPGGPPTMAPEQVWGSRDDSDPSHALFASLAG